MQDMSTLPPPAWYVEPSTLIRPSVPFSPLVQASSSLMPHTYMDIVHVIYVRPQRSQCDSACRTCRIPSRSYLKSLSIPKTGLRYRRSRKLRIAGRGGSTPANGQPLPWCLPFGHQVEEGATRKVRKTTFTEGMATKRNVKQTTYIQQIMYI